MVIQGIDNWLTVVMAVPLIILMIAIGANAGLKQQMATYVILLVALGIIFLSQSPWLVLATALAFFAYYLYVYRRLRRTPGIDPQVSRQFLFVLAFLVLMVLSKLVFFLPISRP